MSKPPECYREWWLHKWVRPTYPKDLPFKYVTEVEWVGPPSGVYGDVWLTYEDGKKEAVPTGLDQYRPYKKDIEVQHEPG